MWKGHNIPISTKIRLMKALVWPVTETPKPIWIKFGMVVDIPDIVTYTNGCESWTLRKNEETRLDAFEMKGLRRMLRVSWTAKKTNEWVLNKAGVKRELFDTVKARKLAYYCRTSRGGSRRVSDSGRLPRNYLLATTCCCCRCS